MNKITINYKNKTALIGRLEEEDNIEVLPTASLFNKFGLGQKKVADVYFHQGTLDKEALKAIQEAKVVIVNSKKAQKVIEQQNDIDTSKIKVLYPAITDEYIKPKESKKTVCEQFDLDTSKKMILFTAKNFKQNGSKEFCDIINSINYKNKQAIIAGDETQINQLKFQAAKYGFGDEVLLIENYPDMNLLFSAADIFILPTHINGFSSNVLKAMFFKTAVFVSSNCASSEIVDVFSTLNFPNDRATPFKVDALLGNKEELKKVKKENRTIAKEYTLDKQFKKLLKIIEKI